MTTDSTSQLERFLKRVPGRKHDLLDVDCTIGYNGDLKTLDGVDVIVRSIINLLLTIRGTYLFDPEYGCDLYKYVFEQSDSITEQDIYMELARAIRRYEDRANITYDVIFFSNKKGYRVNLNIEYENKSKRVSLNIDETLLTTMDK